MPYSLNGVVCGLLWGTHSCAVTYTSNMLVYTFEKEQKTERNGRARKKYWRRTNLCLRLAKYLPRCIHFPLVCPSHAYVHSRLAIENPQCCFRYLNYSQSLDSIFRFKYHLQILCNTGYSLLLLSLQSLFEAIWTNRTTCPNIGQSKKFVAFFDRWI